MNGRTSTVTVLRPGTGDDIKRSLDEMLRRALKVSDPSNAVEVADALRQRYGDAAEKMDQETLGMPVGGGGVARAMMLPTDVRAGESIGDKEYVRVEANVRADLDHLVSHLANREWKPEFAGWRRFVLSELSAGAAAARFGQDPAQRDRALVALRKLSEVARMARLVGILHPEVMGPNRRLAISLDEAASVIRILIGQALYRAGLADGGFVLNVPLTDLRGRRDTLLGALRRMLGTDDTGTENWGEDLSAYGSLLKALEDAGANDLKTYLREESLAQILDEIVDDVLGGTSRTDGGALRELASTLPMEVARMSRLLGITNTIMARAKKGGADSTSVSADFSRFVQALDLFISAFNRQKSGARYIDLAVPLAMATRQIDEADGETRSMLRNLLGLRGELGQAAECLLQGCGCSPTDMIRQVQLDRVLFDIDVAIDLLALGEGYTDTWGDNEKRAGVRGIMAGNLAGMIKDMVTPPATPGLIALMPKLNAVQTLLKPALPDPLATVLSKLKSAAQTPAAVTALDSALTAVRDVVDVKRIVTALGKDPLWTGNVTADNCLSDETPNTVVYAAAAVVLARWKLLDDVLLEMQHEEYNWKDLVDTLAPRCTRGGTNLVLAGQDLLWANPDHRIGRPPKIRAARPPRNPRITGFIEAEQVSYYDPGPNIPKVSVNQAPPLPPDSADRLQAELQLQTGISGLLSAFQVLVIVAGDIKTGGNSIGTSQWNVYVDTLKTQFGWPSDPTPGGDSLRENVMLVPVKGAALVTAIDELLKHDGDERRTQLTREDLKQRKQKLEECKLLAAGLFSPTTAPSENK